MRIHRNHNSCCKNDGSIKRNNVISAQPHFLKGKDHGTVYGCRRGHGFRLTEADELSTVLWHVFLQYSFRNCAFVCFYRWGTYKAMDVLILRGFLFLVDGVKVASVHWRQRISLFHTKSSWDLGASNTNIRKMSTNKWCLPVRIRCICSHVPLTRTALAPCTVW